MNNEEAQSEDIRLQIVKKLRKRADRARTNSNVALISVLFLILLGILFFYFAGDIVMKEIAPLELRLNQEPSSTNK